MADHTDTPAKLTLDNIIELLPSTRVSAEAGAPAVDEVWARLEERIEQKSRRIFRKPSRQSFPRWIGYAAAIGCVLLSGIYLSPRLPLLTRQQVASPRFKEYTTAPGQRATITLKDGTQILLNVASRVRVAEDYGEDSRIIDLVGEAQFTVTHDPKLPFIIRASGTFIRDLATTFVVRAYPGTSATRVAVRDGSVSVQAPAVSAMNAVTVGAGNAAIINSESEILVREIGSGNVYFGWTEGHLVLDDAPLHQALVELSRWYNLDFRVSDTAMLSRRITGSFPQALNTEGLQAIADIMHARPERTGMSVVFHPQADNSKTRPE